MHVQNWSCKLQENEGKFFQRTVNISDFHQGFGLKNVCTENSCSFGRKILNPGVVLFQKKILKTKFIQWKSFLAFLKYLAKSFLHQMKHMCWKIPQVVKFFVAKKANFRTKCVENYNVTSNKIKEEISSQHLMRKTNFNEWGQSLTFHGT